MGVGSVFTDNQVNNNFNNNEDFCCVCILAKVKSTVSKRGVAVIKRVAVIKYLSII